MKNKQAYKLLIIITGLALILSILQATGHAAVPNQINYQGYLTDPQGTPIEGTITITFSLFSQLSGGTALWTEAHTVEITEGVFSTTLGDTTPLILPFDTPYYLGITIGSDSEMAPRQPLTSVGYAFRAKETDTVKDNAVTTTVLANDAVTTDKIADDAISGEKIAPAAVTSTNIANGAVGSSQLGDNSVTTQDLADDAVTVDKISPTIISSISGVTNDGGNVDLEAGSNITITPDDATDKITIASSGGGGGSLWTESGGNVYRDSGNVGIGTTNPQAKLSFGTDLLTPRKIALWDEANNFYGLGLFPGQLIFLTNDTEKMSILDNGNVGIGTPFPNSKLTVEGNSGDYALININQQGSPMWAGLRLDRSGTEKWLIGMSHVNDNLIFRRSASSDDMVINESGKVGIGTISPNQKLTVVSTGTSDFPKDPPVAAVYGKAKDYGSGSEGYDNFGGYFEAEGELGAGVYAKGETGMEAAGISRGIYATASESIGIAIYASGDIGISAHGSSTGIFATASGANGEAIFAKASYGAEAGHFFGDVVIDGSLTKSGGSFKIDHPLDPENKYLSHSFVESPEMMNVYNGNVLLNKQGEAWVELPEWFEALNRDFRYQLTPIGAPGPNLYIAEKITDNRFKIAGGMPQMEVSWQVTGIRQDPYARANPINVEEEKSPDEQGHYLHPDVYGQGEEKSIEWARNPERMQSMKEAREDKSRSKP